MKHASIASASSSAPDPAELRELLGELREPGDVDEDDRGSTSRCSRSGSSGEHARVAGQDPGRTQRDGRRRDGSRVSTLRAIRSRRGTPRVRPQARSKCIALPAACPPGTGPRYGRADGRPTRSDPRPRRRTPRRKTLHDTLVHLEEALSSALPPAGSPAGRRRCPRRWLDVRDAFEQHILVTEQADGLYDEIMERAPRLAGNVRRLRDEHPEIREGIKRASTVSSTPRSAARTGRGIRRATTSSGSSASVDPAPAARRRPRVGGVQRRHRRPGVTPRACR